MVERRTARNLVVSLMLVLLLAACGDGTTPPTTDPPTPNPTPTPTTSTPKEISSTIAEWTGGEAVVKAEAFEDGGHILLAEGTISADGSFSLTLPVAEDIPDDAFVPFNEADICETEQGAVSTVEFTPSGPFDSAFIYSFAVYDSAGSDYLGDIYLENDSGETSYRYNYVASDVTVTGECVKTSSGSGGSASYTNRYNLDFKAGWNTSTTTYGEGLAYSTASIPAGISWYYTEALPPSCEPDCVPVPEPSGTPVRSFLGQR